MADSDGTTNTDGRVTMARLDERLIALDRKLDQYHFQICKDLAGAKAERDDHTKRIGGLEGDVIRLKTESRIGTGVASIVAAVIGVFVKP